MSLYDTRPAVARSSAPLTTPSRSREDADLHGGYDGEVTRRIGYRRTQIQCARTKRRLHVRDRGAFAGRTPRAAPNQVPSTAIVALVISCCPSVVAIPLVSSTTCTRLRLHMPRHRVVVDDAAVAGVTLHRFPRVLGHVDRRRAVSRSSRNRLAYRALLRRRDAPLEIVQIRPRQANGVEEPLRWHALRRRYRMATGGTARSARRAPRACGGAP